MNTVPLTRSQFRRRFLILAAGNATALAATLAWFPAARLDLGALHVQMALTTGGLTAMTAGLYALGMLVPDAGKQIAQTGAALHLLRLVPAVVALIRWPVADAKRAGWLYAAIPALTLLALFSAAGAIRDRMAKQTTLSP